MLRMGAELVEATAEKGRKLLNKSLVAGDRGAISTLIAEPCSGAKARPTYPPRDGQIGE